MYDLMTKSSALFSIIFCFSASIECCSDVDILGKHLGGKDGPARKERYRILGNSPGAVLSFSFASLLIPTYEDPVIE
jgi:hypothetical protein